MCSTNQRSSARSPAPTQNGVLPWRVFTTTERTGTHFLKSRGKVFFPGNFEGTLIFNGFSPLGLSRLPPRGHISRRSEERRSFSPRRRPPPDHQPKAQQWYSSNGSASVLRKTFLVQEESCELRKSFCLSHSFRRFSQSPVPAAGVVTLRPSHLFGFVSRSSLNGT